MLDNDMGMQLQAGKEKGSDRSLGSVTSLPLFLGNYDTPIDRPTIQGNSQTDLKLHWENTLTKNIFF